MNEHLYHTIALTKVPGVGPEGARVLIAAMGNAKAVFEAKERDLLALPGMGAKTIGNIKQFKAFAEVDREMLFIEGHKIQAFTFSDAEYPQRLKALGDAPAVVYYRGTASLNHPRIIGVVGTRKATDYGRQMVENLLHDIRQYNVITVSGLAYGIDIECHRRSLANAIPTIGVMAHGIDMVSPTQHTNVARDMARMGGLMTEHTSGTLPLKEYFPRRNRLVAGLIDALVVVETAEKGGSLITAEIAHSYSRDVYAFPGKSTDERSKGCNMLIKRQKALLIEGAADLAWHMGWPSPGAQTSINVKLGQLQGLEKRIYAALHGQTNQKCHVDHLCLSLNLNQTELALVLLNMEFAGYVKTLPGNHYKAV
ncbi:MAG: DNA-protecting protein DprA [Bacteroidetes bacterium]|jgi:DNA processing protein|nr:DNA-protecting protein DprA [Bacteroidota bacterium]